jgi:hypothetical protein
LNDRGAAPARDPDEGRAHVVEGEVVVLLDRRRRLAPADQLLGHAGPQRQPDGHGPRGLARVGDPDPDHGGHPTERHDRGRPHHQSVPRCLADDAVRPPRRRHRHAEGAEQPVVEEQVAGDDLTHRVRREADAPQGDRVELDLRATQEVGQAGRVPQVAEPVHQPVTREVVDRRQDDGGWLDDDAHVLASTGAG